MSFVELTMKNACHFCFYYYSIASSPCTDIIYLMNNRISFNKVLNVFVL